MSSDNIKRLTLSAIFIAIGYVLPFVTGHIPQIGMMLLPMHLPVFLCGLICGWKYGAIVGFILPVTRSVIFGMPAMFPMATAMAFELAVYGLVIGFVFSIMKQQNLVTLYASLIIAMISGRIVWGLAMWILLSFSETGFSIQAFFTGAFINAVPGIVLQLFLVPTIMIVLNRVGLVNFRKQPSTVQ